MTILNASLTRRRPSLAADVADLDVTPVMNMFIILIPFLVSMAAFTHLAAHHFGLPRDEGAGEASTASELPLTVAVGTAGVVIVKGDVVLAELPAGEDGQDLDLLAAVLTDQPAGRLVLAVDDPVGVDVVVTCLDRCRAAGFDDVGLAAGTGVTLGAGAKP
ncbi:MAG: hypothetical protein GY838_03200 [bacterium]|nr:hypothetical protein [bacterium]